MYDDDYVDPDVKDAISKEVLKAKGELRKEFAEALGITADQLVDILDLKTQDPDMDTRKVIETARKEGLWDMKSAYETTYAKKLNEIAESELRTKVQKELDEKYKLERDNFEKIATEETKEHIETYSKYFQTKPKEKYIEILHRLKYRALVKLMKRKGLIPSETISIDI